MGTTDHGAHLHAEAQDHDRCEPPLSCPATPALALELPPIIQTRMG